MRSVLVIIISLINSASAIAQLPYFAGTVGDGKMYGYSSLKVRPGVNKQETYTTFQYGLGNHFATGIDHSWKFDKNIDLTAGFYYSFNSWNLYVWSNDVLTSTPRFIIGLDFAL